VSKFAIALLAALLSALALSSTASAGVSKYCSLVSGRDIAKPLGAGKATASSVSLAYPSQAGGKGTVTLCSYRVRRDVVAETSIGKFTNAAGARREFAALVHREQKSGQAVKTRGAWTDAYYLGSDGFLVLKGRYMFHLEYASGAAGYSRITPKVLARLSAKATRRL
jgi:hypothetical protein